MFNKIKATVIIMLISSLVIFSQESPVNTNNLKLNAISFIIGGVGPPIGVTYERILSENSSFELGLGMLTIGMGVKFFPSKIKVQKTMLHIGLSAVHFFWNGTILEDRNYFYLPIGLSSYGKKGFNFGIEIGPGIRHYGNFRSAHTMIIPYGSIRFGKRF